MFEIIGALFLFTSVVLSFSAIMGNIQELKVMLTVAGLTVVGIILCSL